MKQQEGKTVHALCKTVWQFLKKLKMDLAHDAEVPLLNIYPKELTTYVYIKTRT